MSEFLAFFQLGFGHIVTAGALDHILFRPSFPALDVWVLRGGSSDHWPVLARF